MSRPIIPIQPVGATQAKGTSGTLTQLPPLSLYIHFPWCVEKCPYCDFNSHTTPSHGIPETDYIAALIRDLECALPGIWGRRVQTVFIGGGTPSLISPEGLDTLLCALRARLPLDPQGEITLEANPGTVEAYKFAAFRAAGVTRLSLGIQSFNDVHLKALGRIHDAAQAHRAIETALRHFERINLDLMYALPQQTRQECARDLAQALSYAPQHLSCYHLTLEPNTPFAHRPPVLPSDDAAADMQEDIEATLQTAGYEHYETSAFARPGGACQHNLNYWTFGDYLGIGAGAHSKLSRPDDIRREMRYKHPSAYLKAAQTGQFIQEARNVSSSERPFEFMMNALRLTQGVPIALFSAHTGLPFLHVEPQVRKAIARGLLHVDTTAQHLAPTPLGVRFLNDLLGLFLHPQT